MNLRPYHSPNDLRAVGQLLRKAYTKSQSANAWSFAHFDIWAQRRLADSQFFNNHLWQTRFFQYSEESGEAAGAIFAHSWNQSQQEIEPHTLILSPSFPELAEEMLSKVKAYTNPEVEAQNSNQFLTDLLKMQGCTRSKDFMVRRAKELKGTPHEEVHLPAGFFINTMTSTDWPEYFRAINNVFGKKDNPHSFQMIMQSPSAAPELQLVVRSEIGDIAAFCSVWIDRLNGIAEFEPVGTIPKFQKMGLAAALLAEECNHLREMGINTATVESWSESPGANRFYESCGLLEIDRVYGWKKPAD